VIDPINKLIDTVEFDAVFYSLDWHPADHVSFIDNIKQRPIHPTSPVSICVHVMIDHTHTTCSQLHHKSIVMFIAQAMITVSPLPSIHHNGSSSGISVLKSTFAIAMQIIIMQITFP